MWFPEQKYNFAQQIIPKMKAIASDSVKATFMKLDPEKRENCFEVAIFFIIISIGGLFYYSG